MVDADRLFAKAVELDVAIDNNYVVDLVGQLSDYRLEFGSIAQSDCLRRLTPYPDSVGGNRLTPKSDGTVSC